MKHTLVVIIVAHGLYLPSCSSITSKWQLSYRAMTAVIFHKCYQFPQSTIILMCKDSDSLISFSIRSTLDISIPAEQILSMSPQDEPFPPAKPQTLSISFRFLCWHLSNHCDHLTHRSDFGHKALSLNPSQSALNSHDRRVLIHHNPRFVTH